ncbi:hypothetical protein LV83_01778 [Algoriphagus yeomjeoni]|uniref:Uncharacterized protein n=1 Tax=Algoriphagus yeomjeoni TaxID=291403 RepID=A0A327PH84_9BACT|nr:hypothetical protein LV83_01778 [Algoriphagus yeomjeoni]
MMTKKADIIITLRFKTEEIGELLILESTALKSLSFFSEIFDLFFYKTGFNKLKYRIYFPLVLACKVIFRECICMHFLYKTESFLR